MKLRYGSMMIKHFKSIKELRFDFPKAPGLYFIKGENRIEPQLESNGCGKSTIFDAVCWTQFGRTPDGLRAPDLVPWNNGGKPLGVLSAYTNDKEFTIERYPARLLLDGQETTQEAIEKKLGFGFETFVHTVLLAQNHKFFLEQTRGDKLGLLSDALELERWDKRAEAAAAAARKLHDQTHIEVGKIDGMKRQLHELADLRKQLKEQSERWEEEHRVRGEAKAKELAALKKELASLQDKYDKADVDYDGAMAELKALRIELHQLADYIRVNDLEILQGEQSIELAKHKYEEVEKLLATLTKGKCPTCGQAVHKSLPKRKELQARLLELDDPCNPDSLQSHRKMSEDLLQQQSALRKAELKFTTQVEEANAVMSLHANHISTLREKLAALGRESEQTDPLREQRQQLRRRHDKLSTELKDKTTEWRANLAACARLEFWSRGYKDIKLDIVKELLEQLQMCCNLNLPQAGLIGWQLEFDIERENKSGTTSRGIDVRVLPHRRKAGLRTKFENWSGGEAQRLSLITTLALSEVLLARAGVEPSLQIFDEPTQHLSPAGVHDLVECLADWARRKGRIVLLADQIALESSNFAETIHVVRGANGTALAG